MTATATQLVVFTSHKVEKTFGDSVPARGTTVSANVILATEVEVRGKNGHP